MTRYEARAGLYAYSLIARATWRGRLGEEASSCIAWCRISPGGR